VFRTAQPSSHPDRVITPVTNVGTVRARGTTNALLTWPVPHA